MSGGHGVGYVELLRARPAFLKLWLAEISSLAGDWFTLIALYSLLLEHTGSGESVGLMLATRFLPPSLWAPFSGVLADRLPRKWILVTADLGRAATVLGFLLVRDAGDVWLIYALVFVQMSLSAFFDPCEAAAIASVVEPSELVAANTLVGATWSAMLSLGAVAGGLVVAFVGREAAFGIDASSYLVSALLISRAALPRKAAADPSSEPLLRRTAADLRLAAGLARDGRVRRILLVKSGWAMAGGGAILLYAVLGDREFPVGGSGTAGIGVLLATRGIGALAGPLLARGFGGDDPRWLERAITIAFVLTAVFYIAFAYSPVLWLAATMLCIAHTGISTQWTFSSSLLALTVPGSLRGRAFALDTALYTLVMGLSSWATGAAMDRLGLHPRTLMAALGGLLVLPLLVWLWSGQRSTPFKPGPGQLPSHDSGGGAAA